MKTEIFYEDKDILVVYKPAGLATQSAKIGQADVVSELKNYLAQSSSDKNSAYGKGKNLPRSQQEVYLGVIHRLDQPVEGLILFAKNKKAAADLTSQLQKQGDGGSLHKHYYAVICGKPSQTEGRLVDYMFKSQDNCAVIVERSEGGQSPAKRKEALCAARQEAVKGKEALCAARQEAVKGKEALCGRDQEAANAKKAILEYRVLQVLEEEICENRDAGGVSADFDGANKVSALALVDINILTGRFHQIRAQMAHAGMPLLGDVKYGTDDTKLLARKKGVQNVALGAYCLDFVHPVTREKMHFQVQMKGKAFALFS